MERFRRVLEGRGGVVAGAVVALAGAVLAQATLGGRVADLDGFYHLGHASVYLERSVFDTTFPWTRYSAVGVLGADLWWGFHILLLPFAAHWRMPGSIHAAGVALTAVLLFTVFVVARRHGWRWPWVWPLYLLVVVPNSMFRWVMVRPHVLSMAAGMLLASFLARREWRGAAAAAAFLVWVHASMFWMPVAILGAYATARVLDRWVAGDGAGPLREGLPAAAAAVAGGVVAGLLLRPHPLATWRLVDVQIFRLLRERGGLPMSPGGELVPLPSEGLFPVAWLLLVPWVAAASVLVWQVGMGSRGLRERRAPDRVLLFTALFVSVAYLTLSLEVASRALAEWSAFACVMLALMLAPSRGGARAGGRAWSGPGAWINGALFLTAAVALPWIVSWQRMSVRLDSAPPDQHREVAEWLIEASDDGDVVFHTRWDQFAPLFAWNRTNRYLVGMDPVFLYAQDPERYFMHTYLAGDGAAERTCTSYPCRPADAVDTHTALRERFGARWVLVEPRRNPRLFEYFARDPRYAFRYRTATEAVFEVLPDG